MAFDFAQIPNFVYMVVGCLVLLFLCLIISNQRRQRMAFLITFLMLMIIVAGYYCVCEFMQMSKFTLVFAAGGLVLPVIIYHVSYYYLEYIEIEELDRMGVLVENAPIDTNGPKLPDDCMLPKTSGQPDVVRVSEGLKSVGNNPDFINASVSARPVKESPSESAPVMVEIKNPDASDPVLVEAKSIDESSPSTDSNGSANTACAVSAPGIIENTANKAFSVLPDLNGAAFGVASTTQPSYSSAKKLSADYGRTFANADQYHAYFERARELNNLGLFDIAARLYSEAASCAPKMDLVRQAKFEQMSCYLKAQKTNRAIAVANELRQFKALTRNERVMLDVVEGMK